MTHKVAIVGSGPAGFYTADAILKLEASAEVDIIESLPTPFGLIRYGVAPDHQSIKNVARAFQKTAQQESVRFFGHVTVGSDVAVSELLELYDAVVLATGAPLDREWGVPGETLNGVIGSAAFVGWYNSHPDHVDLNPDLDVEAAAVIGVGNVALDVARLLARSKEELEHTDTQPGAVAALTKSRIRDIYVLGRRGPLDAPFTPQELKEFGEMERAEPVVDASQLPETADGVPEEELTAKKKNLAILQDYAARQPVGKPVRVHFRFFVHTLEILGQDRVEGLRLEHTEPHDGSVRGTGKTFDLPCGLVIPCIGYRSKRISTIGFNEQNGHFDSRGGVIAPGLYAAGWAGRGPTGTIATNRADGQAIARHITENCPPDETKPGRRGLTALLQARDVEVVSFEDWQMIDAAEQQAAHDGEPRVKFTTVDDMLDAAHPHSMGETDAAK